MSSEKLHQIVEKFSSKKTKVKCEACPQRSVLVKARYWGFGSAARSSANVKLFHLSTSQLASRKLLGFLTCKVWRDWTRQCPCNTSCELQPAQCCASGWHLHTVIKQDMQGFHCSLRTQVSSRVQSHSVSKFYFWDACKGDWGACLACTGPGSILSAPNIVQIFLVRHPEQKMLLYKGK